MKMKTAIIAATIAALVMILVLLSLFAAYVCIYRSPATSATTSKWMYVHEMHVQGAYAAYVEAFCADGVICYVTIVSGRPAKSCFGFDELSGVVQDAYCREAPGEQDAEPVRT